MYAITSEKLSQFEVELNQFSLRGIPIGSLITSHLNLDLLKADFNPRDFLKEMAMYYYIKFWPRRQIGGFDFSKHEGSEGLPILTFISERRHIFGMAYPVFEALGPENVFCLIKDQKVLNLFKTKPVHYALRNELPSYPYKTWRMEFRLLWKQVKGTVEKFIASNHIPANYKIRIRNHLLVETRYLSSFEIMLTYLNPKYLLVEHDRYSFTAPLSSVSKKLSIPVFTMMHGVIGNSLAYTPLIADRVFVWGERQKRTFIKYGLNEDQIIVSGAPQMSNEIHGDNLKLRTKLGIPTHSKVILLATNPVQKELRTRLFDIFCNALEKLPDDKYYGFLKIHPSENIDFYTEFKNLPSNLILEKSQLISYEDSFALADLVCNYNSAFAIDALLRSIPLVTINVDSENLGQAKDFIEHGGLPIVKDSDELIALIEEYFKMDSFSNELIEKGNRYANEYCVFFGEAAARNILLNINAYVDKTENIY